MSVVAHKCTITIPHAQYFPATKCNENTQCLQSKVTAGEARLFSDSTLRCVRRCKHIHISKVGEAYYLWSYFGHHFPVYCSHCQEAMLQSAPAPLTWQHWRPRNENHHDVSAGSGISNVKTIVRSSSTKFHPHKYPSFKHDTNFEWSQLVAIN